MKAERPCGVTLCPQREITSRASHTVPTCYYLISDNKEKLRIAPLNYSLNISLCVSVDSLIEEPLDRDLIKD